MQLFAYIAHKNGVAEDSAAELAVAAAQIAQGAAVTAVVIGSGDGLDAVCNQMTSSYSEVIKVDNNILNNNRSINAKLLNHSYAMFHLLGSFFLSSVT